MPRCMPAQLLGGLVRRRDLVARQLLADRAHVDGEHRGVAVGQHGRLGVDLGR